MRRIAHSAFFDVGRKNAMASKNKDGRETRKPKEDQNKRVKGQTPSPVSQVAEATRTNRAQPQR